MGWLGFHTNTNVKGQVEQRAVRVDFTVDSVSTAIAHQESGVKAPTESHHAGRPSQRKPPTSPDSIFSCIRERQTLTPTAERKSTLGKKGPVSECERCGEFQREILFSISVSQRPCRARNQQCRDEGWTSRGWKQESSGRGLGKATKII